jgi:hypothetical protein
MMHSRHRIRMPTKNRFPDFPGVVMGLRSTISAIIESIYTPIAG